MDVDIKKTKLFDQETIDTNSLQLRETEVATEINIVNLRCKEAKESITNLNSLINTLDESS